MTALPHPPQKHSATPARPEVSRRMPQSGSSEATASGRPSRAEPFREARAEFDALLLTPGETPPLPQPLILPWEGPCSSGPSLSPDEAPAASPVRAWQQLEPPLCGMVEKQPAGPVAMTLLLPLLGEVDARLPPFAAGWDISLRFAPPAMNMMAAHQERCRASLRRRMACAVRLRFEQRGGQE